jgi:N utilization substance protein B
MGVRRQARECALQILYQLDTAEDARPLVDEAVAHFFESFDAPEKARTLTAEIVRGVAGHRAPIDDVISKNSPRWKIERMAMVDRNVLRLCIHELMFEKETPARVVIDEGIEIARRFGGDQSPAFVNGVLDAAARQLDRLGPDR